MTVTAGHPRRVQSNGGANMPPPAPSQRTRGTHGSIGSGLSGSSGWAGTGIWTNSSADSAARASLDGVSGSSSLLASSESDGWNTHRNVPWPSRPQSNGMTISPVQSRSADRSATALSEASDAAGYFAQPASSGIGPSPSVGQRNYLDSGSERISPVGEASVMGSRSLYGNGDRRNVYAGTPVTSAYQAQSGFTSPLENPRSEQIGSLSISAVPQTLADTMQQRNSRSNYAHSSHNSASFAPQRPSHSAYPSFHSESQFNGHYANDSADLNAELERMQLNEVHTVASRPAYISHASLDSSLSHLRNQSASEEDIYQPVQGYANDTFSQTHASAYQTESLPHLREQDLYSHTGYALDSSHYNSRPNGSVSGRRCRNGYAHSSSDNQIPLAASRLSGNQPVDFSYPMAHANRQRQFPTAYNYPYPFPVALANLDPVAQLNAVALANRPSVGRGTNQELSMSAVMADFKSNNSKNRKWELKDISGHVVEFSGDQHGSRFLQTKIEVANSDDKERVFQEILPDCLQLSKDIFGNYVIQKMFEHGNQIQKKKMANCMKGQVISLTKGSYGCRVVQKALEHVLTDQQISIVKELETDVIGCVRCQHGNHVIQKAIEKVPPQYTKRIVETFKGQVAVQATHMYGCRVMQRMLEYCDEEDRSSILAELHACTAKLIEDQYGNYVVQHVICYGREADRSAMIKVVNEKLYWYSKHKFASNVVEKCLEKGNEVQSRMIIQGLTSPDEINDECLNSLMSDQYGNYVIQKVLGHLKGKARVVAVERLRPLLAELKRTDRDRCGKQIAALEKLIGNSSPYSNPAVPASNHSSTTPPHSHKSSPQPLKRSVEDRFMETPPTPPPTDNQTNGTSAVTSNVH
ncbi:mRNA-binding protein PUF3 [Aspergillus undulatus]|uniref:mRNA-binding protein PUF3 n=1 Tax=Aspergillus undulatus TaxID=1810928 RepID=UPI003CCCCF8F